jgi:hypothetical protein
MAKAKKKAAAKRRASGRKSRRQRVTLENASPAVQRRLATRIRAAMRELGISDRLAEVHVEPARAAVRPKARGTVRAPAPAPVPPPCPPNTERRVVCAFRNGTFVCEPRCVPIADGSAPA